MLCKPIESMKISVISLTTNLFLLLLSPITKAQLTSTNLPIMVIKTPNGAKIPDEPKITADMSVYWEPGAINTASGVGTDYHGKVGIELRGNSSKGWPKKPYLFETRMDNGDNRNVSLMGLPKENDWVLHAPIVDKTQMRNALIYRVLGEMGGYAPRYSFCELVLNNNYQGVYLLVEKLKVDKNRINIDTAISGDVNRGYILEKTSTNRLGDNEPFFETAVAKKVMAIAYPKENIITSAHKNYIKNYFDNFEQALNAGHISGANDYKQYIDVNSFIDHMLVSEVFKQLDAFYASHYFHKNTNGKLVMGPGWDYNRSLGNYTNFDIWKTDGLWLLNDRGGVRPFWPKNMYADPNFMALYKARYTKLRQGILSQTHINAIMDEYVEYLGTAIDRNFQVWDINLNLRHKYVQGSYSGEINYVKNFFKERLAWLDNHWGISLPPVINELFADGAGTGSQWIEFHNKSSKTINLSGWKVKIGSQTYTFPSGASINSDKYLILCSNKSKFTADYPGVSNVYEGLSEDLLKDELKIQVLNPSNSVLDEISTSLKEGWPVVSKSGNYSIGMATIAYDNSIGFNWNWSTNEGGTPGKANDVFEFSGVYFSEAMSYNISAHADEQNQYDDWVEIYNSTKYTLNLTGLYLSDKQSDFGKWQLLDSNGTENAVVGPEEVIVLWLDNDEEQGNLHVNFGLNRLGDQVYLSKYDGYNYKLVDQIKIPLLNANQSYQINNAGSGEGVVTHLPTPGVFGAGSSTIQYTQSNKPLQFSIYPNLIKDRFSIDFYSAHDQEVSAEIVDVSGKTILQLLSNINLGEGRYTYSFNKEARMVPGVYFIKLYSNERTISKKILVIN